MADRSARFARYLQSWWDRQIQGGVYPGDWRRGRDENAIAHEFRRDAQFELSQARFLLRRPNAEIARSVVERLVPEPIEADATVLVAAIVRAGASAQRVRATGAIGAIVTVLALVVRNVLRGR